MDNWEVFFAEKSRRRSRHRSLERAMKSTILILLMSGMGAAIYLGFIAQPQ